jgi:sodium/potassium-transporting ATPase subunit alpha
MIKGAPEILLPRCGSMLTDKGHTASLTEQDIKRIEEVKDNWSRQGKRVILLARKNVKALAPSGNHEREILVAAREGLTFVGLVGIVDPPVCCLSSFPCELGLKSMCDLAR